MTSDSTSANPAPEDSGKKAQANTPPPPVEETEPLEPLRESEKGHRTMESGDFDTTIVAGDTTLQNASLHVKSNSTDSSSPRILDITQKPSGVDQTPSDLQRQQPQHTSAQRDVNESFSGDLTQDVTIIAEEPPLAEKGEEEDPKRPSSSTEGNNSSAAKAPSVTPRSQQQPRPPVKLNIEPPPPLLHPWDLVSPAEDRDENNNGRLVKIGLVVPPSAGGYSSAGSQGFGAMQSAAGNGRPLVPKSSYYFGPPGPDSAYGTPPVGQIGVHHPREILRIERDYTGGEVIQFAPIYPLELENRLTPTQFLEAINSINEILISAHSIRYAFWDNLVTVLTLQLSRVFLSTHFQKEMKRLQHVVDDLNVMWFNPVGLNILWPGDVAFLFLEIEYYVVTIYPLWYTHHHEVAENSRPPWTPSLVAGWPERK